jgi:hypothetical protein
MSVENAVSDFKMYVWYCDFGWNDKCRVILPGVSEEDAIERFKRELARLGWEHHQLVKDIESRKSDEDEPFQGWFYIENQRDD